MNCFKRNSPNRSMLVSFGVVVLSVITAGVALWLMVTYWQVAVLVSIFLLVVIVLIWFGEPSNCLFAMMLLFLAFALIFLFRIPPVTVGSTYLASTFALVVIVSVAVWVIAAEQCAGAELRLNNAALQAEISERRRAAEAYREREEFLGALMENANDFIRLHDIEGRSVYASPSVERLYGQWPTLASNRTQQSIALRSAL